MIETERGAGATSGLRTPEQWMARATWFELLALGLLKPERPVAEALAAGEFLGACRDAAAEMGVSAESVSALGDCLALYEGRDAEEVYHEVLREYTRLFVGEREPLITPFAGVRAAQAKGQRGLLFVGPESMAVERFMRRAGVAKDVAVGQSNDPVDHIGTMCEFAKFLCLVNARAVVPAEGARVEEGDFDRFMADHFVPYATWCAAQLRELSHVPLYRALADMLDAVVGSNAGDIETPICPRYDATTVIPADPRWGSSVLPSDMDSPEDGIYESVV